MRRLLCPPTCTLIYSPLRREKSSAYTLPEVINAIKGPAARRINALLNGKGPVWQEEFFDHVRRSNEAQRQALARTGVCLPESGGGEH